MVNAILGLQQKQSGSAKDTFTGCLHLVEAWAVENRLILGQRSVPEGGHEITTAPDLLAALDLKGWW